MRKGILLDIKGYNERTGEEDNEGIPASVDTQLPTSMDTEPPTISHLMQNFSLYGLNHPFTIII